MPGVNLLDASGDGHGFGDGEHHGLDLAGRVPQASYLGFRHDFPTFQTAAQLRRKWLCGSRLIMIHAHEAFRLTWDGYTVMSSEGWGFVAILNEGDGAQFEPRKKLITRVELCRWRGISFGGRGTYFDGKAFMLEHFEEEMIDAGSGYWYTYSD
ncbi:hypothetical protein BOTBODRAFT_49084 [Botryobasidium botryosum FD-172 SS1]|uniref:Uncharacterized protein n=1 Tax=Botryobasidium botryosum (strain FD-172 SS1) TaxID=930990 RepID=A0A067LXC0_BOTB1|nr:hypothetical protein BOTBODRAFT_49084 [Botryobasidium botryosum FD-172 SS1]